MRIHLPRLALPTLVLFFSALAGPAAQDYRLQLEYYDQNEFGRTTALTAYDATVRVTGDGPRQKITWTRYDRAEAVNKAGAEWGDFIPEVASSLRFTPFAPGTGLTYPWRTDDFDLKGFETIPGIVAAPKDMEGFRIYLHAIDLFTFLQVYPAFTADPVSMGLSTQGFAKVGDKIFSDQRGHTLRLMDWPNVGKDLVMQTGFIEITWLADTVLDGRPVRLFGFQQSQRFGQTVTAQGFSMPMDETTRFLGHLWIEADGTLARAEFQEYVYVLVHAPMLINVTAHAKRHFLLTRTPEGFHG